MDSEAQETNYVLEVQIYALSRLYERFCNCRKDYPELDNLLDPDFHLEECPYFEKVKPLNLIFEK